MSGEGVLLDSVILIDHFNSVQPATDYLAATGTAGHISAITYAEVLTGFQDDGNRRRARLLLARFGFIELDSAISELAADLRRTERWKLPDAFQAAAAVHHGLRLATRNTKDFSPEKYDYVLVPYELA